MPVAPPSVPAASLLVASLLVASWPCRLVGRWEAPAQPETAGPEADGHEPPFASVMPWAGSGDTSPHRRGSRAATSPEGQAADPDNLKPLYPRRRCSSNVLFEGCDLWLGLACAACATPRKQRYCVLMSMHFID